MVTDRPETLTVGGAAPPGFAVLTVTLTSFPRIPCSTASNLTVTAPLEPRSELADVANNATPGSIVMVSPSLRVVNPPPLSIIVSVCSRRTGCGTIALTWPPRFTPNVWNRSSKSSNVWPAVFWSLFCPVPLI